MKGVGAVILISGIAIIISIALLLGTNKATVPAELFCETPADCVPAQCCHADSAINKQHAPDCTGTFCTAECAPKTLDCKQGEIKCIANTCRVVLK